MEIFFIILVFHLSFSIALVCVWEGKGVYVRVCVHVLPVHEMVLAQGIKPNCCLV